MSIAHRLQYDKCVITLVDGPEETWRSVLELNVLALSVCTKLALQSMKERGVDDGHIIHINR
jgi:NAD(P)-dependent dehydrogenase (short-subunit alcohol dehydrogenase family)